MDFFSLTNFLSWFTRRRSTDQHHPAAAKQHREREQISLSYLHPASVVQAALSVSLSFCWVVLQRREMREIPNINERVVFSFSLTCWKYIFSQKLTSSSNLEPITAKVALTKFYSVFNSRAHVGQQRWYKIYRKYFIFLILNCILHMICIFQQPLMWRVHICTNFKEHEKINQNAMLI